MAAIKLSVKLKGDTALGDFDGDKDVDGLDLVLFAGDFNTDGYADGKDLSVFATDLGKNVCP